MQKVDSHLYLIFLPVILILVGGIGIVLTQNHPSTVAFYCLQIGSVLAIIIGPYVFFRMRRQDPWPNRAQDICQRYQGTLNIIGNELGRNSYAVDFIYKDCKIQFLDTVMRVRRPNGVSYVAQDKLLFRCPISNNINIYTEISAGSSLIGHTFDFLKAESHKDLSLNPQLSMYKGMVICSNDENKAISFLTDPEVRNIYLKYTNQCTDYSGFPLGIENGYVNFKFVATDSLRLKKEDDLNPYLDDLILLTKKL